ncbi:MAG TPA: alginate lyase family protein [Candidatus Solibacter sp.]|nr:alginate lyase family protein [Candidatus Solibacter sp.]
MQNRTRREFCLALSAACALPLRGADNDRGILVTEAEAAKLRSAMSESVRENAASALKSGPWSVTTHRPPNVDAGPNDYYSEGPYWWPDPKDPKAPYIRKDGERNPDRFMGNRNDIGNMCSAVLALGMSGYLLNDKACGAYAARVLSTWFLDSKTRMNPNLEYGQAVRGHNTGRGTGLIDTVSMIHTVQGVWLLERAGMLDASIAAGVREWFTAFTRWMTTSKKGLDEKKSGNNHATWWTAQVAAYASFTRDAETLRMAWDHYRTYLVPTEIEPDGSCPREEARTNSLGYSAMNLDAFSTICRIAATNGVALWRFLGPKGVGVAKGFHYLAPFIEHPSEWKKQQISKFNNDGTFFMGLAGVGLHDDGLLAGYRKLPRSKSPWTQFLDMVIKTA